MFWRLLKSAAWSLSIWRQVLQALPAGLGALPPQARCWTLLMVLSREITRLVGQRERQEAILQDHLFAQP